MKLSLDKTSKVVGIAAGLIVIGPFAFGVLGSVLPEEGFGFVWLATTIRWFSDQTTYLIRASALVLLVFYFFNVAKIFASRRGEQGTARTG